MFKLNQATAEGWTITGDPLAIVSTDPTKSDLTQRSHVFNQIMAGSPYHIQAFQIVTAQDASAIALVPDVQPGAYVKLTAPATVMANVDVPAQTESRWDDGAGDYVDVVVVEATTEQREVTKPTGTLATVRARFGTDIVLAFSDDAELRFTETDETWFPFAAVSTFNVYGNYGVLTVDRETGAVLDYKPADGEDASYADVKLIDVAELRETLGDIPDNVDIALVGSTLADGTRDKADRLAWISVRLDDPDQVEPTLAAFIKAEFKKCGRSL